MLWVAAAAVRDVSARPGTASRSGGSQTAAVCGAARREQLPGARRSPGRLVGARARRCSSPGAGARAVPQERSATPPPLCRQPRHGLGELTPAAAGPPKVFRDWSPHKAAAAARGEAAPSRRNANRGAPRTALLWAKRGAGGGGRRGPNSLESRPRAPHLFFSLSAVIAAAAGFCAASRAGRAGACSAPARGRRRLAFGGSGSDSAGSPPRRAYSLRTLPRIVRPARG